MTALRDPEATTPWRIGVLDGPNLSNIGNEAGIRHHTLGSWDELHELVTRTGQALGVQTEHFVNNYEGQILEWIHRRGPELDGLLVNPGGLVSYGEGLRHALEECGKPYVEVHLFNTVREFARVSPHIRLESRLTSSATGLVSGFGQHSYTAALVALTGYLDEFAAPGPASGPASGTDAEAHAESDADAEEQAELRATGGGHV